VFLSAFFFPRELAVPLDLWAGSRGWCGMWEGPEQHGGAVRRPSEVWAPRRRSGRNAEQTTLRVPDTMGGPFAQLGGRGAVFWWFFFLVV
jgi:hypothetical protein